MSLPPRKTIALIYPSLADRNKVKTEMGNAIADARINGIIGAELGKR